MLWTFRQKRAEIITNFSEKARDFCGELFYIYIESIYIDMITSDSKLMQNDYFSLTPEEKKIDLFLRQKRTLDLFLERNAISRAQYDKSLGDLIEKMGMSTVCKLQTVDKNE